MLSIRVHFYLDFNAIIICVLYAFVVLGRCLPSFISDTINKTANLAENVGTANETEIRDAKNQTITIESILDGSGSVHIHAHV